MEEEIKELLGEEVRSQIESLSLLPLGSEEHTKAVENLTKLYRLRIEEIKNDREFQEKMARMDMEREFHNQEEDFKKSHQLMDTIAKYGIEVSLTCMTMSFYNHLFNKGLTFETTGTVTSSFFRNFLGNVKPGKRK